MVHKKYVSRKKDKCFIIWTVNKSGNLFFLISGTLTTLIRGGCFVGGKGDLEHASFVDIYFVYTLTFTVWYTCSLQI